MNTYAVIIENYGQKKFRMVSYGMLRRVALVVPPKRLFLQEPHGVTSQKIPFFIVTAVKTSNPTEKQFSFIVCEILTAVTMKCSVTWDVMISSPVLKKNNDAKFKDDV
jgi:hypothetical protein